MSPRAIFLSLPLVFVSADELSTQYSEGRAVRVRMETTIKMETTSLELRRDGEPIEGHSGGSKVSVERSAVQVDRTLASSDGRPTRVRRSFEELDASSTIEFGEESRDVEGECPLDGVTLELTADDDGDVDVEVTEGDTPDTPGALQGHRLELDLDALLPPRAVEVDAGWDLESQSIRRALGLEVERALFPREESESESGGEGGGPRSRMRGSMMPFFQQAEWSGKAKLVSLDEEHGGKRCARIEIEIEASGDMPEPQWGGDRGRGDRALDPRTRASGLVENTYEVKLEGEFLFALGDRLPVALELEGTVSTEMHVEREGRDGGSFEIDSRSEGSLLYKVEITLLGADEEK